MDESEFSEERGEEVEISPETEAEEEEMCSSIERAKAAPFT